MKERLITFPLDIPDVRILKTETDTAGDYIITVESTQKRTQCRRCGQDISQFHGYDNEIELRHLSILGRRVYIRIRPARYQCPYCSGKPTTTQRLDWYDHRSRHTRAYEEHILLQLVNNTIQDVSLKEHLGYEAVNGIVERWISSCVDWSEYKELGVIGIDEIAMKKGHRNFVAVITVRLKNGRTGILGVLNDRQKETVKAFLLSIPVKLRQTVHTVCTDMWEGYITAVYEVFARPPEECQVKVVIDRFHVAEGYYACADRLRKQEARRLKKELPEETRKQIKKTMWPFRMHSSQWDEEETERMNSLFGLSPALRHAYDLREKLTDIFEQHISRQEAVCRIKAWEAEVRNIGIDCFDTFLTTLNNWMDEIVNYFIHRNNSGFVEGMNNRIKVIKRRAYGILNIKHMFQRLYLDLEGYRLFA